MWEGSSCWRVGQRSIQVLFFTPISGISCKAPGLRAGNKRRDRTFFLESSLTPVNIWLRSIRIFQSPFALTCIDLDMRSCLLYLICISSSNKQTVNKNKTSLQNWFYYGSRKFKTIFIQNSKLLILLIIKNKVSKFIDALAPFLL